MSKNYLYDTDLLPVYDYESLEECQECTGWYNNGDYIIDTFYNGNWRDGVQQLLDILVTPYEFAEFVEDKIEEDMVDGRFLDRLAFCNIQALWLEMR